MVVVLLAVFQCFKSVFLHFFFIPLSLVIFKRFCGEFSVSNLDNSVFQIWSSGNKGAFTKKSPVS